METSIFLGVVISALFSFIKPYLSGRFGTREREALILIVLLISIIVALVRFYFGNGFWENAAVIFASTQGTYNLIWGLVGEDKIAKLFEEYK